MSHGSVASDASAAYKSAKVKKIVLIGHSLGGDAVFSPAQSLMDEKIPVALMIVLDAAGGPAPANVRRVINYYVGGGTLSGRTGIHGSIQNIDVSNFRHGPRGGPIDGLDASEDDRPRQRDRWPKAPPHYRTARSSDLVEFFSPLRVVPPAEAPGGLVAGWAAGQITRGHGFGLLWDVIIGIVGAFIGDWLLPRLGIHVGTGIAASIVNAMIGAVILLLLIRLVRGGPRGGWRRSWGRRW